MNAVNTLAREQEEQSLEAATADANKWAEIARPIIITTLRIDQLVEDDLWELRKMEPDQRRTYDEANGHLQTARRCLDEMLDGIRSDFLADQYRSCARNDDEAEAFEIFNEALDEQVISVKALIRQVERDDYDAFIRGDRK